MQLAPQHAHRALYVQLLRQLEGDVHLATAPHIHLWLGDVAQAGAAGQGGLDAMQLLIQLPPQVDDCRLDAARVHAAILRRLA